MMEYIQSTHPCLKGATDKSGTFVTCSGDWTLCKHVSLQVNSKDNSSEMPSYVWSCKRIQHEVFHILQTLRKIYQYDKSAGRCNALRVAHTAHRECAHLNMLSMNCKRGGSLHSLQATLLCSLPVKPVHTLTLSWEHCATMQITQNFCLCGSILPSVSLHRYMKACMPV